MKLLRCVAFSKRNSLCWVHNSWVTAFCVVASDIFSISNAFLKLRYYCVLMFVCPFIFRIMTNSMQLFGLFTCTQSALHVLGDVFAHHQEHVTVFTASDIVHLCFWQPVTWTSFQHRWTISEAVNTVKCSWWWAKTSPETCRGDWVQINKPKSCILLVINYELYSNVYLFTCID